MNKVLYDILNNVNEGIIVLNEKSEIYFWNNYMECITGISEEKVLNNNICEVLPELNKNYFHKAMNDVTNNGCQMFFSAAMHKRLVSSKGNLNLKISKFENNKSKLLLLEFIDVTNQFIQISKLKDCIKKLYKANIELKEKEKEIKNLAYYDKLTGVANRTLFYELAEKLLSNAKRNNNIMGLMFIDVDKFKSINDTFGHEIGDKILIKVANILKDATRKNDVVARHGGDEFLILLPYIRNLNNYKTIASRIVNAKNKAINYNGKEINISLSMGISFYPDNGDSIDKLIVEADNAMYIAKKRKGEDNCFCSAIG